MRREIEYKGGPVEPFEMIEPKGAESPLVVEVPHAGLWLDGEALAFTIAPARSIARDADLYVDQLFQDAPGEGATPPLRPRQPLRRRPQSGRDDCDGEAVEGGGRAPWPRGLVWRLTTDGEPVLEGRLPRTELERRLDHIYRPYHRALAGLIERKRRRFGFAIVLCAHSMPSQPRPRPARSDPTARARATADGAAGAHDHGLRCAVPGRSGPGTRGRTSAAGLVIDRVDAHGRAQGWTIRHDDPYRGGFSTANYGRPAQGVHAVQIEIARRRYMDETSLRIDPQGFRAVREFARTLAARLAFAESDAPLRQLRPDAVSSRG